jgi:superfamily II DNA or RNA helicase
MIKLRDYQTEAVEATFTAWRSGLARVAHVVPTGGGKTVIFASVIDRWLRESARRGQRAMIWAHRDELISQAYGTLMDVAPHLQPGIVQAGRNQTRSQVIVSSIQTLASQRRRRMVEGVGLIVIDECHHATARTYMTALEHYGAMVPGGIPVLGVTATMVRGDGTALGSVWQDVVFRKTIGELISEGWLVRPRGVRVRVATLDLSQVKKSRGDYQADALGTALEDSLAPEAIAKAIAEHARERQGVVFTPTVHSAGVVAQVLSEAGFTADVVHGEMPIDERRRVLKRFRAGDVQWLVNCAVLTEGTDLPMISCVVVARPTTSPGLWIQMVGRGLRLHPGKRDCLVLDVVGASARHSLNAVVQLAGADLDLYAEEDAAELADDETVTLDGLESADEGELAGVEEFGGADGPLVSEEVDLFHGSHSAWNRTRGGTWFLSAGERLIVITRNATGLYDVTAMHGQRHGTGRHVVRHIADLSYAMSWAEGDVTHDEEVTARRERSWRARRPSEAQLGYARRLGIAVTEDMRSGEVSDQISIALASARIDPAVAAMRAAGQIL